MKDCRIVTMTMSILLLGSATNQFLDAPDDKPVSAKFRGTEWSDDTSNEEIPLTARVITTRLAKMSWGAIFKIERKKAPQNSARLLYRYWRAHRRAKRREQ